MTANQIAYQTLLETQRSNLAKERESHRSNVANEGFTDRKVLVSEAESPSKIAQQKAQAAKDNSIAIENTRKTVQEMIDDALGINRMRKVGISFSSKRN